MKILRAAVILVVMLFFVGHSTVEASAEKTTTPKKSVKDLSPKYKKWLKDDVEYIISKWEKQVFLQLESDREREMFMAAFWKNRDPNVYTEENEYKTEHYRRIKYADDKFGKGTPTSGRRTEQGRIYIILGEPNSIERYDQETEIYPVIIWFYSGLAEYGLPNAFYVVFFKEDNSGDFELYSPLRHGPHKLLVSNDDDDTHDITTAYNKLLKVIPNVAKVSMSLIEGDTLPGGRPTVSSDILISKQIVEAPTKRVNDEYAKKLLKYKNYIDVDYSVNYIPNKSKVKIFKDDTSGLYFVHYLVEPQKLSLEQFEDSVYGNLEINGSVFNKDGESIYQFSKNAPIRLKPNQMEKVKDKLFSFQDFFPLIPGNYRLEILIRNTTSKEFTSVERDLVIPATTSPGMGMTLLANNIRRDPKFKTSDKPFFVNGTQMLASPQNDFTADDKLYFFFQVYGLTEAQIKNGYFVFSFFKDDDEEKPLKTFKKAIADYSGPDRINFMEEIPLAGMSATYYVVRVSVYGKPEQFLFKGEEPFFISPVSPLTRPWVVSLSTPADGPEHLNSLAIQYTNIKDYTNASNYLEQAYHRAPNSAKLALNYCQLLLQMKNYQKIKTIATPFLQTNEKQEFYSYLGYASASLGEYVEAITHFKDHLAYFGTNIKILNAIGECYRKLGNKEEALIAWQKSLELLPDQEQLRTLIKELKKDNGKGTIK